MDNQYLFSIIIPTYNRADDLQRCLNSLVAQTYKKFEVLVCDDGSTDYTKDIIENFKEKLILKYFYLQNTGGPATPRNIGIREARGEWICFLDSDDWYVENRLEIISKLKLDEFDFLYHDLRIIKNGEKYRIMRSRNLSSKDTYYDLLCNTNSIPTSSTCIRRELLKRTNGFDESKNIIGVEDFDFWLKLAKLDVKFKYIPEVLGFYAVGNDNITYHDERQINRYKALYIPIIESENNKKITAQIKAVLNYHIACINIKNRQFFKANQLLISSFLNGTYKLKKKVLFRFLVGFIYVFK